MWMICFAFLMVNVILRCFFAKLTLLMLIFCSPKSWNEINNQRNNNEIDVLVTRTEVKFETVVFRKRTNTMVCT